MNLRGGLFVLAIVTVSILAAALMIAWPNRSPFGPRDWEDCAAAAAKSANSKEGLKVLLSICNSRNRQLQAGTELEQRQQIEKDEFQRRKESAARNIEIQSRHIQCAVEGIDSCIIYDLTIRVKNQSSELISSLAFGWAFLGKDESMCPSSLPTKHRESINLRPGGITVLNIHGYDGPSTKGFRLCVMPTSVELQ
jgi:hypothetical protein